LSADRASWIFSRSSLWSAFVPDSSAGVSPTAGCDWQAQSSTRMPSASVVFAGLMVSPSRSHYAVFAPRCLVDTAIADGRRGQRLAQGLAARRWLAIPIVDVVQRRGQACFIDVAKIMIVIVRHLATLHSGLAVVVTGYEAVRVITEALGIDALELDREVGGAAIVGGIEPVGFAAGAIADLNHLNIHSA